MKSYRIAWVLMLALLGVLLAMPGVKVVKTTSTTFHGFLGTMMKMGGGNKAYTATSYLEGDRMRTDRVAEDGKLESSNIVDLDREVRITINHKKKEYTEMTFEEFRAMMAKMKEKMANMPTQAPEGSADVKMEYAVKVTPTGEKQTLAGFKAEKYILTLEAKGEKAETATEAGGKGGMVITSTQWLAKDAPGKAEAVAFGKKFAEKMGLGTDAIMNQWQALAAFNPQLAKGLEKLAEEGKKMEGVAVKTESVFETWSEPGAQAGQTPEGKTPEIPSSLGNMLGGFGKKHAASAAKPGSAPGHTVLFESSEETKEITTGTYGADLYSVPNGYKKVEAKMQ